MLLFFFFISLPFVVNKRFSDFQIILLMILTFCENRSSSFCAILLTNKQTPMKTLPPWRR